MIERTSSEEQRACNISSLYLHLPLSIMHETDSGTTKAKKKSNSFSLSLPICLLFSLGSQSFCCALFFLSSLDAPSSRAWSLTLEKVTLELTCSLLFSRFVPVDRWRHTCGWHRTSTNRKSLADDPFRRSKK